MRKSRVACLIACSIAFLSAFSVPSRAEVIGDIKTSAKDSFSVQFEGQVGMLWRNGSLPVTFHVVQPGEDVGKIWIDRYSLSYFPSWMNALTCDLNPDICYRPLHLPEAGLKDTSLTSTFQLGTDPGIWFGMKPGSTIVLPDLNVVRDTTSVTKRWDPRKSYAQLKKENYACQKELIDGIDCDTLFDYYNPSARKKWRDEYEDPIYTYTIHIDSECARVCAIQKPVSLLEFAPREGTQDLWFKNSPFELVTSSDLASLEPAAIERKVTRAQFILNRPTFSPRITSEVIVETARDRVLDLRIDASKDTFEKNGWSNIQQVSPLGRWSSQRQRQYLMGQQLPVDEDAVDELLAKVDLPQAVMIVDNAFDERHCEFAADNIVVYDCKNKENDFSDTAQCKIRKKETLVANVSTDDVTGSTTRTMPGGCTAADVVEEVQNTGTKAFRDAGHGTHLAGIIGAQWADEFGTGGLNPMALLVGVEIDMDKARNDRYGQWLSAKLSKIMQIKGVRIVNLSLGFTVSGQTSTTGGAARGTDWVTQWIKSKEKSALFVAAAGNERDPVDDCLVIPACKVDKFSNIVSVVALDASGSEVMPNANFNKNFTLGAMGELVFGPAPKNKYSVFSGSSQSAAIVSGAISLAKSIGGNEGMSPSEVRNRLIACSSIDDAAMLDKMVGGRLDFDCFVNAETDIFYLDPSSSIPSPVKGEVVKTARLNFTDIEETDADDLDFDRILGFQRIASVNDDIALFWSTKADGSRLQPTRKRGSLDGEEVIQVRLADQSIVKLRVKDIVKYVKNTVEGG